MASSSCNNHSSTTSINNSSSSSTIMGHYEFKRTLGKGNFSTVKLAQHRITHHLVAIKIVKTTVLSEDNLVKINREIDVLKKLGKHDHIVRLYQVIKTKRYFMLVTEYCSSGELFDYIAERGKLSEPKACDYFLQILSAVEYLHDHNIVHRDLKAENLLLTDDFKTVKIADFGFANYFKHDKFLSTWCGSPPYAAPELFKGLQYVGPPVDIWSLGVILYILICGQLPFDGPNLVFLKSRVLNGKFRIPFYMSTESENLIRGMLRLNPDKRFGIRHIRAHNWIAKYSGDLINVVPLKNRTNSQEDSLSSAAISNKSTVYMDIASIQCSDKLSLTSNLGASQKNLGDKNNLSARGHSLDLKDDEKNAVSNQSKNEDTSMLCLDINVDGANRSQQINVNNTLKCLDTEMANAVSNMSLDSNNSSMSISQILETSNHASTTSRPSSRMRDHLLTKEHSMDEQILTFMVDGLRLADNFVPIRESIENDKYDDLHAIYRLLRDQPQIMYDAQKASQKFKIPSLPLISINRQQGLKKPSITTGILNDAGINSYVNSTSKDTKSIPFNQTNNNTRFLNDHDSPANSKHNRAINLTKHKKAKPINNRHKKSEDRFWKPPPQLFLTPPADSMNAVDRRDSIPVTATRRESELAYASEQVSQYARHSFDSTMQQLDDASKKPNDQIVANHLALSSGVRHSLWDSSILDTLGMSTPAPEIKNQPLKFIVPQQGYTGVSYQDRPIPMIQNFAEVSTNLPQIGNQARIQDVINQNMLLAHMNMLALPIGVTQSSTLSQNISIAPLKFTPNDMIVGQNCNIPNNLNLQNSSCAPNLCLLDPNGLNSGLERRASDGQASYKSLTTSDQVNRPSPLGISPEQASQNLARAFLSSSSNQLSNQRSPGLLNPDSGDRPRKTSGSDNSMQGPSGELNKKIVFNSLDANNNAKWIQISPLDLTKETGENGQQDLNSKSNEQQSNERQSQRSNSTASTTSVDLQHYQSITPSKRLVTSSVYCASPQSKGSPSTLSLNSGGPGHLPNRRKRHSLETESRHHHIYQQHLLSHHHNNSYHPKQPAYYSVISNQINQNETTRLSRHANQQYLQYPINSHIGQLRNLALTSSYKNLTKRQSNLSGWNPAPTSCDPSTATFNSIIQNAKCSGGTDMQ